LLNCISGSISGSAENAGPENRGPIMSSLRDQNAVLENARPENANRKMQDQKCRVENEGPENAGLEMARLENVGPVIQI